ncbi:hypothetical protein RUM44_004445, partial [Polyplax serrata]
MLKEDERDEELNERVNSRQTSAKLEDKFLFFAHSFSDPYSAPPPKKRKQFPRGKLLGANEQKRAEKEFVSSFHKSLLSSNVQVSLGLPPGVLAPVGYLGGCNEKKNTRGKG